MKLAASRATKRALVDIDDTLLQFSTAMQTFLMTKGLFAEERLNEHHNIEELFGLTMADTVELVSEFHRSPGMEKLSPEPSAAVVLPELHRRGYSFVGISACLDGPEMVAKRARNLYAAFGFSFEAVHCVGLQKSKATVLRSYPKSIWIEDVWDHARSGALLGHQTFLLDRPYNRDQDDPTITRVADWHDIAMRLY